MYFDPAFYPIQTLCLWRLVALLLVSSVLPHVIVPPFSSTRPPISSVPPFSTQAHLVSATPLPISFAHLAFFTLLIYSIRPTIIIPAISSNLPTFVSPRAFLFLLFLSFLFLFVRDTYQSPPAPSSYRLLFSFIQLSTHTSSDNYYSPRNKTN